MAHPELLESMLKNQEQITLQQHQITQLIKSQKQADRELSQEITEDFYKNFKVTL